MGARRPAVAMVAGWGAATLALVAAEAVAGAKLPFVAAGLGVLGLAGLAGTIRRPFAPGSWQSTGRVLVLAIPLLSVAAATVPSGIDEYSHWLANLGYLVQRGHLPTLADPNLVSVRPGYPYGLAFIGYAASLITGRLAESAGIVWSILLLLAVAILTADILEAQVRRRGARGETTASFAECRRPSVVMAGAGPPSTPDRAGLGKGMDGEPAPAMAGMSGGANVEALTDPQSQGIVHPPLWGIAAICVLFCTLLSPSFVAKLFLSNYGDPAAGSVIGVMTAATVLLLAAEPSPDRGPLVALGFAAVALVNIRQDSASLLPIFLAAALAAAFTERRAGRAVNLWSLLAILPVPLLATALWRAYQAEQIPGGVFSVLPMAEWHWRELPQTLSHMAETMVAKPGHFGLMLLLVVVAVAALRAPSRFTPWQRTSTMMGAWLGSGKTASMLVLYLVADFSAGQAAVANSFWRLSIQCGPPLVVAGLTLLPIWRWNDRRWARTLVRAMTLLAFLAPIAAIRQLHDAPGEAHIGYLRRIAADMAPLVDHQPALALIDLDNDPGNLPNIFPIRYELLTGLRPDPRSPVPDIVMLSGAQPRRVVVRGQLPEQFTDGLDTVSHTKFQWFSDGGAKAGAIAGIPLPRGSSYLVEHIDTRPAILRTWPTPPRK